METIRGWANFLSKCGEFIGLIGILSIVAIICADVLGSKLFGLPVPGSTEVVSLLQVATMALVVAATQRDRGHVGVDMFVQRFPIRVRAAVRVMTSFLGLALFVLLVGEGFKYGNQLRMAHEVTGTVKVPIAPFVYVFSLAMIPAAMMMLCDLVDSAKETCAPWNR
jgi:TRAP-type C4-dicarboxylate transport system permease small subunit